LPIIRAHPGHPWFKKTPLFVKIRAFRGSINLFSINLDISSNICCNVFPDPLSDSSVVSSTPAASVSN
ncbi:MAG: hypothetical protein ACKOEZ_10940, partial [Spartobacteria bacterium]